VDVISACTTTTQARDNNKYPSPYHAAENGPPNFLIAQSGRRNVLDVTAKSGLNQNNTRYSFCCGWSDYNRDGWPDLYVVNDFGRKSLPQQRRRNLHRYCRASRSGGHRRRHERLWLNYANDSGEDLYVGNMWTAAGEANLDAGNL